MKRLLLVRTLWPKRCARRRTESPWWTAPGDAARALADVLRLARERNVRCEARERAELDALADGVRHQDVLAITGEYSYLHLDQLLASRLRGRSDRHSTRSPTRKFRRHRPKRGRPRADGVPRSRIAQPRRRRSWCARRRTTEAARIARVTATSRAP